MSVRERGARLLAGLNAFGECNSSGDYLPSRLAERVLDMAPFERCAFMGHSWGGSIGVQLAAVHPARLDGATPTRERPRSIRSLGLHRPLVERPSGRTGHASAARLPREG